MACHVIGITGGIASGKSTVTRMLEAKGLPIVDADIVSRRLVEPGTPMLNKLVAVFGPEILLPSGSDMVQDCSEAKGSTGLPKLNRQYLGKLVFSDKEKLDTLNFYMHPAIWKACFDEISLRARGFKVVGLVAPLLLEYGGGAMVDTVWVVDIPEEVQLARLQARDSLTEQQAQQRIASQMSRQERLGFADVVISNCGTIEETQRQVDIYWQKKVEPFLAESANA